MYFAFTEEQESFRASLQRLLRDRASSARVRELLDSGFDPTLWKVLTEEMGLPGLHVPEDLGGQGFTYLETAVVMQELGRCLAPVPAAATVFALEAILRCGTPEQKQTLVPKLATGAAVGALAVSGIRDVRTESATVQATPSGAGHVLRGVRESVIHGHLADLLVVPATDPDGDAVSLYVVEASSPGVLVRKVDSLDLTRPVARVVLDGARAFRLGEGDQAENVERALQVCRTLLAFESLGAAERCLELSVEYAKTRHQFNRPIGSFQAIKHTCSDMAVEIDISHGAAMYAVMVMDSDPTEFAQVASLAKAQATETLRQCADDMIQVHGGIGFTWEHDAHLYFRRAKANEVLLGNVHELRDLLADRVGL